MTKKLLTLCLIVRDGNVLLGLKKRGVGVGKWNGFGGKVDAGETVEQAARRELFEEAEITAGPLQQVGLLHFSWSNAPRDVWEVAVFTTNTYEGQPQETEEMKPQWFDINEIPFEKMWPDDKYWFPLFLAGKQFEGTFLLDTQNTILQHSLHEVRDRF